MTARSLQFTTYFILLFGQWISARPQTGHAIRGKVRNSAGYNLAHVRVDLELGNGPLVQQTVTNNEGDFYFSNLSETSYAVAVSAPGYEPVAERVDFFRQTGNGPGETRVVEIVLVPKSGVRPPRRGLSFVQNIPKDAQNSYELALKFLRQGKRAEAVSALQEAIKIFPDYFNAHLLLGSELMTEGMHGEAIKQFEEARRINPRDDRVYELFGHELMRQGKYGVAAAVFAEAARMNVLETQYLLLRGIALIEYASTIDPSTTIQTQNHRLMILNDAETSLKRAFEVSGKKLSDVHLQLARVYEKRGQRDQAATELEQYLREFPDAKNKRDIRAAIDKLRSVSDGSKTSKSPH